MILLKLTMKSLLNRRITLMLSVLSIAISVWLLLGVEYMRHSAKTSFMNTVSGTDVIVGARSGSVQLLLYSVFRIGHATNNIDWSSYQHFAKHPQVKWSIPLALGDSHKGYRVLGSNQDYFKHYQYGERQHISFAQGRAYERLYDAVIGADVAKRLGYSLGKKIIITHGAVGTQFTEHGDKPFTVTGILAPTGTPIDQTIHIKLEGIEAMHINWRSGAPIPGLEISAEKTETMKLQPKTITAFMLGLHTKTAAFSAQREVNQYQPEALLGILPGVALAQLWQSIGQFELILRIITSFVLLAGLLGMLTTLLTTLNERRREMAILRITGAHPWQIFTLFVLEATIIAALGCLFGTLLLSLSVVGASPWVSSHYGLYLQPWLPHGNDMLLLLSIICLAAVFSALPASIAYKRAMQDGLSIKV